ncbi:MAG: 50S ribosomal protein L3 [Myxococcota bacterium]
MASGMVGEKLGMTQIFKDGRRIPVTVIKAGPCVVLQKKNHQSDGYNAIQVGFGPKEARKCNKPALGHFQKAGKGAFHEVVEFRIDKIDDYEVGQEIDLSAFEEGQLVMVTGTSKGRGFQGVMKRHGFAGGRETHGSMNHRRPGSIGQCAYPARVFRGHRMAGQMGNRRVTVRNLEVVDVDKENNLILLKGAVPGANHNFVLIRHK